MARTRNDNDNTESQDEGNPTEGVDEDENTAPDGQTATTDVTSDADADFVDDEPTRPVITRDEDDEDDSKPPKIATQLAKALGLRSSDVLSYNERTRTAVFSNGGKYQVSKNGKSVRHLAGPQPPRDLKLQVIDARTRSSLVGAAAVLNSQANDPARAG